MPMKRENMSGGYTTSGVVSLEMENVSFQDDQAGRRSTHERSRGNVPTRLHRQGDTRSSWLLAKAEP